MLLVITVLVLAARRHRYLRWDGSGSWERWCPQSDLSRSASKQWLIVILTAYLGLFIMVCWGIADWAKQRRISVAWLASASAVVLLALSWLPIARSVIGKMRSPSGHMLRRL